MSKIDRDEFEPEPIEERRARRRVFWLGAIAASLVAAITSLVAIVSSSEARATGGFFGGHHGPHGHGIHDGETVRGHAEHAVRWMLHSVDASQEQQARVGEIVGSALDSLAPLAQAHRAHRRALAELLAQESIDRGALESLRAQELGLADEASRRLIASLAEIAEALTPAQRAELFEFASRFHD